MTEEIIMGLFDKKPASDNEQRLEELKKKYQAVLRLVEQQQVRLQHVYICRTKSFF
jgi:hypothetical protein